MSNEPRAVPLPELLAQLASGGCDPTRRAFCAGAAAGAGLILLGTGCDSGASRLSVGVVDNPPGSPTHLNADGTDLASSNDAPDMGGTQADFGGSRADLASNGSNPDLASGNTSHPDLAGNPPPPADMAMGSSGACSTTAVNAGPASAIAVNTAQNIVKGTADFFLCRDSKGLYALDNYCPHRGCNVNLQPDNTFYCYCHGAQFGFDGSKLNYVSPSPLYHLSVCIDGSGNAIVDTQKTVSASTRV
jgi:Rieske Fe-S protein